MSIKDEVQASMYAQSACQANSDAELKRMLKNTDRLMDGVGKLFSGGNSAPPKSSGGSTAGNVVGGLLAGAAVAGGIYLLSKVFGGSSDDNKSTTNPQPVKKKADYINYTCQRCNQRKQVQLHNGDWICDDCLSKF